MNELFVYKVLELLGVGPKVHVVFNEFVKYGLFIITEDLNSDKEQFIVMTKLEKVLKQMICRQVNCIYSYAKMNYYKDNNYEKYLQIEILTEIDIIYLIFHLTDANTGNFGFLIDDFNNY